jgi:2-oxoglutarate ferredoxin oxidoreductase subunit alpha
MGALRAERVERAKELMPAVQIEGVTEGDLLVLAWGSNVGKVSEVVAEVRNEGGNVAHATVELINPLQNGVAEAMSHFKRVLVCESNSGQLASHLRSVTRHENICALADTGAQPFAADALKAEILSNLNLD